MGSLHEPTLTLPPPAISVPPCLSKVYLAEEALSLPAAKRETLSRLLLASVSLDKRSADEIRAELKSRLAKLKSGEKAGVSFKEVFREPLPS